MKNHKDRGSALIITVLVSSIFIIFASVLAILGVTEAKRTERQHDIVQAYYVARSGADSAASWIMGLDPTQLFNLDFPIFLSGKLSQDDFKVEISKDADELIIESTGFVGEVSDKIELVMKPSRVEDVITGFDMAAFSMSGISIGGSSTIIGPVCSNSSKDSSIELSGSARIDGDLYVVPGADADKVVDLSGSASIHGDIKVLNSPRRYLAPKFPDFPEHLPLPADVSPVVGGNLIVGNWPHEEYTISGDCSYSGITVSGNGSLIIELGESIRRIKVGKLEINQGNIILKGQGRLELYVEDSFKIGGSSAINGDGTSDQLLLYYAGDQPMNIKGSTKVVGNVYIKEAALNLGGSGNIVGNIVTGGKDVNIGGGSSVYASALYAPYADVVIRNSGIFKGAVVAGDVRVQGGSSIIYDDSVSEGMLIPVEDGQGNFLSYEKDYWK
ncbi:MAG: hypothetical protein PHP06_04065 [Clostridia bacterium]|nr:hypothetical protein [Clostridia bacterium]